MTSQNSISNDTHVTLPLPPSGVKKSDAEIEIYARFMRHLRHVPNNRTEIKILSAIQFTADMTDNSDAHVAKILVDYGLLAPRMAFPAEFLRFADAAFARSTWSVGGPSKALLALKAHWESLGEERFSAYEGEYSIAGAGFMAAI
ncbi:MAG: hypothetical protein AAF182_01160 [Pseudomonadota bacterium]